MKSSYRKEYDEALFGRVGSVTIPVRRLVADAMNTVRSIRSSPLRHCRRESQWWAIVFEEAMLAIEDHIAEHGDVAWQPRFTVDNRNGGGGARRKDRIKDYEKACETLAKLDAGLPQSPESSQ